MKASRRWPGGAAIATALLFAASAPAADENAQVLAPSGRLRAALYPGTPTSVLDPKESEPRGVGYELGRELARRLGVPYEPVVYSKNADVLEAVKTGKADVAFTNASPARRKEMNFGPPFLVIELGYLVPAGSAIAGSVDVDRKGVRVGVTAGSTSEGALSRDLKEAELVRAATNQGGAEMLAAGTIDAFATNKATLFGLAEKVPGAKVIPDTWGEERHAVAFPHGREQGAPFIKKFTEDALAEGLVRAAMDRAVLRGARTADKP
ncbi:MAG TPA: transporter substrate-binding domain-containing protein [Beijerinckiaceae bacterium]|jgi:polar amino acid transport system substrate-binding protein